MAYYTFSQNNSGGFYRGPQYVIVEAESADEANERAETYSEVYFDGCRRGLDCECCGDRWSEVNEQDATEVPTIFNDVELSQFDYELYTK